MAKFLTDRSEATLRDLVRDWRSGGFSQGGSKSTKRQLPAIQEIAIGVTAEVIAPGGSGDVSKWTVTSGSFAAVSPTETLEAHDWLTNGIADDTRVVLARMAHADGTRWVAIPAASSTGLVLVKLDGTLTAGGSATAIVMVWTGTAWDDTGASITVDDSTGKLSGVIGDLFWMEPNIQSGQFELIGPGSGSSPAALVYGGIYQGTCQSTTSAREDVAGYAFSEASGVTVNTTTGEITIDSDGVYRIWATANVIYTGTFGGLGPVISGSHSLELWKNGSQLGQSLSDTRVVIIDGKSDLKSFSWHQDRDFVAGDDIMLRYLPNHPGNSDYNNDVSDACFSVLKLA